MELRKDYIMAFSNILQDKSISVLNIYGEAGIGKTHLIGQLKSSHITGHKIIGGMIDISRFDGMSSKTVTENMYAICDILTTYKKFKPTRFSVADAIDSKRNSRLSYTERVSDAKKAEPTPSYIEAMTDIKEMSSVFFDLSNLNNIITVWNLTQKYYNKFKPHTPAEKKLYKELDKLDDKALHDILPQTLAEDINACEVTEDKRIVIFVDNFNDNNDLCSDNYWLDTLINKARDVLWVFVSRNKLKIRHPRVHYQLLEGISDDIMNDYLIENNILDMKHRKRIIAMCNGSPFYANKMLEIAKSDKGISEDEWYELERKGLNGIAKTFIEHLHTENKELMYILANTTEFDSNTFAHLFPERIFSLNKDWFNSSIFVKNSNGFYSVHSSTKELILNHLKSIDPRILSECHRKLFEAEFHLLNKHKELPSELSYEVVSRHLSSMCKYAMLLNDSERFFNALTHLKSVFIRHGETLQYCEALKHIIDRCAENVQLETKALFELAVINYLRGSYRNAEQLADQGYNSALSLNDGIMALKFLTIGMDIAEIAPSDSSNAAEQVITLAEKYIDLLEELRTSIPYKQYITNRMTAHIYAAKAYTVKENHNKVYEYLDYIFDICSDQRKVSSLSLYGIYARACEVKGNMHGTNRSAEETISILQKAVNLYDIAEAEQLTWDTEFQINCARAHKRLAENYLNQADYENGIRHCNNALSRYELIKRKNPENTTVYCNICFTLLDCSQFLITHQEYETLVTKNLECAIATADEAIALLNAEHEDYPNGNRQLCNIKCIANRLYGITCERNNSRSEAEAYYKQALCAAENSISVAPTHPYGYYEYATTCLSYAQLLRSIGLYDEASRIAAAGMNNIIISRKYTDNPNSFSELYSSLSEYKHDNKSNA